MAGLGGQSLRKAQPITGLCSAIQRTRSVDCLCVMVLFTFRCIPFSVVITVQKDHVCLAASTHSIISRPTCFSAARQDSRTGHRRPRSESESHGGFAFDKDPRRTFTRRVFDMDLGCAAFERGTLVAEAFVPVLGTGTVEDSCWKLLYLRAFHSDSVTECCNTFI